MPNHFHGIIRIGGAVHKSSLPHQYKATDRRKMLLPKAIGYFKMTSAKRMNDLRNTPGIPVWQRNYYEHVIRNEDELLKIREYIRTNPLRWAADRYNPERCVGPRENGYLVSWENSM